MRKQLILASALLLPALGQTRLDIGRQARDIDFSSANLVRPFRTGTTIPTSCVDGEMFFKTLAPAGSNVYGCTATNTWTLQGAGSTTPFQPARTDANTLLIGTDCSVNSPCNIRIGATTYTFATPAAVTVSSGSGMVHIYVNSSGVITAGISIQGSPTLTCSACDIVTQITQFPSDSIPIAVWGATSGAWEVSGTDERAVLSGGRTFVAGSNIIITEAGNLVTIAATVANPADTGTGGSGGATGGTTGGFNALDMTSFDRAYIFSESGYLGTSPWAFSSGCGAGPGTQGARGEVQGLGWQVGNGGTCQTYYAGGSGRPYPLSDFLSGSSPLPASIVARYSRGNADNLGAGDHYIGWSAAYDNHDTFVGVRYSAIDAAWQCVIRNAGTDVTATAIPSFPDTAVHTFMVSTGTAANSVTCKIDNATQTVIGSIPSHSWFGILGTTIAAGASGFTTIEARIHISGIAR